MVFTINNLWILYFSTINDLWILYYSSVNEREHCPTENEKLESDIRETLGNPFFKSESYQITNGRISLIYDDLKE